MIDLTANPRPEKTAPGGWKTASGTSELNPDKHAYRIDPEALKFCREKLSAAMTTASGVSVYGFRWYDAKAGRWVSTDPIGEEGGVNTYGFVDNNPIQKIDNRGNITLNGAKIATKILLKKATPFAIALNISALAQADLPPDIERAIRLAGLTSGAGAVFAFFPDTCELAGFSIFAGAVNGPPLVDIVHPERRREKQEGDGAFNDPDYSDLSINSGGNLGVGLAVEAAYHTGRSILFPKRGEANANSFEGVFRTIQGAGGPYGVGAYWGVKDRTRLPQDIDFKDNWFGTTFSPYSGYSLPGAGIVDWEYRMFGGNSLKLEKEYGKKGTCACMALAYLLF